MPTDTQVRSFYDMGDQEFQAALRAIVTTSDTEEQVRQRLRDELGYPYSIAITSHQPTDEVGREASALVAALGGSHLRSGAMVMVMAHGPSGATIHV